MAMKALKPVAIPDDVMEDLQGQLSGQTASRKAPKSRDPKNYPVFEIPLMGKRFIYVANHTYLDDDGIAQLRMDRPLLHLLTQGNQYKSVRCIHELVSEKMGYDGSCPLCDVVDIGWSLAEEIIDNKCRAQGLNPDDKENSMVKSIRSTAFGDRAVKDRERYYTFPIVVFDTDDACKKFEKDEDGNISYTIMWYCISERQYNKTWKPTLESLEDEPTHPGGKFFLLNYTYDTKGKEPTIRDSAGNLTVVQRNKEELNVLKPILDEATESWTPALALKTVITNELYPYDVIEELAEDVIAPSRNLLDVYKSKKEGVVSAPTGDTGGFNLQPTKEGNNAPASPVDMGETDLDMD